QRRPSGFDALGDGVDQTGSHQTGGRVEHHDVASGTGLAGEDLVGQPGVDTSVTAAEVVEGAPGEAQGGRVHVVGANLAVAQLVHGGGGGDGELVETVVPVDHQRSFGAVGLEDLDHPGRHVGVGHARHLTFDPGRVGQRPEDVEHG